LNNNDVILSYSVSKLLLIVCRIFDLDGVGQHGWVYLFNTFVHVKLTNSRLRRLASEN